MSAVSFDKEFDSLVKTTQSKFFELRADKKRRATANEEAKSLIVNYLPPEMTEVHLQKLFGVIGDVKVFLMRQKIAGSTSEFGESLGYGFLDYYKPDDGAKAIEILNGAKFRNKTLKVSISRPAVGEEDKSTNIYVSGLPPDFDENEFKEIFSKFGNIISSRMLRKEEKSKFAIGFVRYEKKQDARRAIEEMDGEIVREGTTPIQVRFKNLRKDDEAKKLKLENDANSDALDFPIYVYNLSQTADENTLWKLFGPFGAIKSAKVVLNKETGQCKGFGFVTMKHLDEATLAIQTLNGYSFENKILQVSFKDKNELPDRMEINGVNMSEIAGAYTLYVYNINPKTEDNAIWKLFGQFGAVKNVKLIHSEKDDKNIAFAFVTMKNQSEAADAVKILNGFVLNGRPLQVSFKTKKNPEKNTSGTSLPDNKNIPSEIAVDKFGCVQIFIYNLSPQTDDRSIWKLFGQFGAINNVKVLEDQSRNTEYRGHAFVSMKSYDEAKFAVNTLNGTILDGRTLQVSFKLNKSNSKK